MPNPPIQPAPPQLGLACDALPTPPTPQRGRFLPGGGGNPRGNPASAPRCGARTRAGRPCQAPAVTGKTRCRMHGGRSTGARTPEGLARLRAAATIHGVYGPEARARERFTLSWARRGRVLREAVRFYDGLPPDMRLRLFDAPELMVPEVPAKPARPLSRAQERALAKTEAAALAPWKAAIAAARAAAKIATAPHAPRTAASQAPAGPATPPAAPPAPGATAARPASALAAAQPAASSRPPACSAASAAACPPDSVTPPRAPRTPAAAASPAAEPSRDSATPAHAPRTPAPSTCRCAGPGAEADAAPGAGLPGWLDLAQWFLSRWRDK